MIGVVGWLILRVHFILGEVVDTLLNSDDLALDEKPQQILNRKLHLPCMRLQLIFVHLRHGKIILHLAYLLKNVLILGVSDSRKDGIVHDLDQYAVLSEELTLF